MPKKDNNILKYKHGEKSLKAPLFISFDNEVLSSKMCSSQNSPKESYIEK